MIDAVTVETKLREAIVDELQRQAANSEGRLTVTTEGEGVVVHGPVDLDDLSMVVLGCVAGGP